MDALSLLFALPKAPMLTVPNFRCLLILPHKPTELTTVFSGDLSRANPYPISMMNDSTEKVKEYDIEIEGHLDEVWEAWFEGFAMIHQANGRTILTGPIQDQAALNGIFKKINNLGMKLISLNPH